MGQQDTAVLYRNNGLEEWRAVKTKQPSRKVGPPLWSPRLRKAYCPPPVYMGW